MIRIHRCIALIALLTIAFSCSAYAQQADRDFDLQTFKNAPGRYSFLNVEGARVDTHLGFSVGGVISYAYLPLGFVTPEKTYGLVKHLGAAEFMGSLAIYEIFEIGLVLPVTYYMGGEDVLDNGLLLEAKPSAKGGINDPRLHLKLDLLNGIGKVGSDRFGLAFITVLSFPLGNNVKSDSFLGDSLVTVQPKLAFEASVWRLRFGLNAGYLWREEKEFYQANIGQRLTGGFATEILIHEDVKAIVELLGENGLSADVSSSALEMHGAFRFQVAKGVWLSMGAGGGLQLGSGEISYGMGTPRVRAFAGVKLEPPKKVEPVIMDRDNDGIMDDRDRCPDTPEDMDNFKDKDGCPDRDNDEDGIKDEDDKCPDLAEDRDGFKDEDGCPDSDNDFDGIKDNLDKCPLEPEDLDGFEDRNGCPDPDNDQDGFLDIADSCPDEMEVFNGVMDEDGCPDEGRELVVMHDDVIEIKDKVNFKSGSSKIVGKTSFDILNSIAVILKAKKEIKVRIEGHTDSRGRKSFNQKLSQNRAESVRKYLIEKGVEADRLQAQGFGPDKPIASNRTRKGRADNRRVEFHILQ